MTLPQKKTRIIEVNAKEYRWLISKRKATIELSIEAAQHSGQLMQVSFEPHDSYKRDLEHKWQRVKQGVSITPKLVRQIIQHGLANGWQPNETGKPLFHIQIWKAEEFIPELPELSDRELRLRDIAWEQLSDLRSDFSCDPKWRERLFSAAYSQRFLLPNDYSALSAEIRSYDLKFAVFNDGWTEDGYVVFGIESVEFPDIVLYTFNNPEVI